MKALSGRLALGEACPGSIEWDEALTDEEDSPFSPGEDWLLGRYLAARAETASSPRSSSNSALGIMARRGRRSDRGDMLEMFSAVDVLN